MVRTDRRTRIGVDALNWIASNARALVKAQSESVIREV
jgi:hypothetical protein